MPQHLKCLAAVIYNLPLFTTPVSNLRFDKVIAMSLVVQFFGTQCMRSIVTDRVAWSVGLSH